MVRGLSNKIVVGLFLSPSVKSHWLPEDRFSAPEPEFKTSVLNSSKYL